MAIELAMELIGNGLSDSACFAELRNKFEKEVTDSEIEGAIRWAKSKNPSATVYQNGSQTLTNGHRAVFTTRPIPTQPKRTPIAQIEWWNGSLTKTVEQTIQTSPVKIPESSKDQCLLVLELLYFSFDNLNIVCDYTVPVDKPDKAIPKGGGKTLSVPLWQDWVMKKGVPESKAGAWIRTNPSKEKGSGHDGAVTNADIMSFRYLLIESDVLPLEIQLGFYSKLKLPISAILSSGGKSVHVWVKVDCADEAEYSERAKRILTALEPFGVDKANKNPSRLSRLPGAKRTIGAEGDGIQRLMWIQNKTDPLTEEALQKFEKSLQYPLVQDAPMKVLVRSAIDRYEELFKNQGKLGVPTGFQDFDRDTGGWKPKQMVVVAAESNGGKSTFALNAVNAALHAGHGVLLATLEMDRDEICDLLVSMNCRIDRNVFNTGMFVDSDFQKITTHAGKLNKLPLFIEDSASMTVAELDAKASQLAEEGKIKLVVADYAQIFSPEDINAPREQQIAKIARGFRASAKNLKLPYIVLSQLNDEGKLRESRVLAHEAHTVILLETDDNKMKMKVVKGRSIRKKDYLLNYQPEYCLVT